MSCLKIAGQSYFVRTVLFTTAKSHQEKKFTLFKLYIYV